MLRRGRLAGRGPGRRPRRPTRWREMMVGDEPPRATARRAGARARRRRCCAIDGADRATTTWACPRCIDAAPGGARRRDRRHRRRVGQRPGASWSRCWPASAPRDGGDGPRRRRAPTGATRAEMRALTVRCLPEEPLRNACVGAHVGRREHRLPRASIAPPFTLGWALRREPACASSARALIARLSASRRPVPDAPIAQPVGRQRAARGAGARAVGRRVAC